MSKPVKEMITAEYKRRFEDLEGALIVDIRGVDANDNNTLRLDLREKNIQVTIVKNTLAKQALAGTMLEAAGAALEGPSALVYGADSVVDVARELVIWARKVSHLDLKGAVLDGEYFGGEEGVKRLSKFPSLGEAKARVVQLILTPAGNIIGAATSPGSMILGAVKEIEQRLEKGQTIAKAG